jgi:hypothetical protein
MEMRPSRIVSALGVLLWLGCATTEPPKVDSAGLVRVSGWKPGELYAHPARSIDDYDDILVGDMVITYAPNQTPLSAEDTQRLKTMVYDIVTRQIAAGGQLAASGAGPCTVKLGVELADLEFPKPGSRATGSTTVNLVFFDSQTGDPMVRYGQHRDLTLASGEGQELQRVKGTLEIVAEDVRLRLRDALPLNQTGARSAKGCKGVIGMVRQKTKQPS